MNLNFGRDKKRPVSYEEFTEILHDFHEEHAVQAFKQFDSEGRGYIKAMDFYEIMTNVKSHLLTPYVKDNLVAVAGGRGASRVTFPYFMAFNNLLNNMELIKKVFTTVARNNLRQPLTKEEFLTGSQVGGSQSINQSIDQSNVAASKRVINQSINQSMKHCSE